MRHKAPPAAPAVIIDVEYLRGLTPPAHITLSTLSTSVLGFVFMLYTLSTSDGQSIFRWKL
jgi:hypothetical protein